MKSKFFGSSNVALVAMALLAVVLIGGCSKFKDLGVYDKSVPVDQLCTLEIEAGLYVREFDEKKVGSFRIFTPKASGWGIITNSADGYASIKIPAGDHTLLANFAWGEYDRTYEVKGLNVSHDFIAGHTYRLSSIFFNKDGEEVGNISSASTLKLSIVDKGKIDKAFEQ